MNALACPGVEHFVALLRSELSAEESGALFEHAACCSQCGAALGELEQELSRLAPVVRLASLEEEPYLAEPQCHAAVALAERFGFEQALEGALPGPRATPVVLREYRLLEKLGAGGMGEVFKAFHTRLERVVALKILPPARLSTPQAIERFRREVRAAGRLDHPCIVRATDAGEVDGTHFLVMDFVDGLNLSQLVRRLGPLPVAEASELVRQAASGLEHAHAQGLVHRDIKPSNLMLSTAGQVKILDLGLARWQQESPHSDELTASGQIMGTVEYMAPEQFDRPHEVDIRADIYSLGCVLFHQLTGHPPFPRRMFDSVSQLMAAHCRQPIPSPGAARSDIPTALTQVVERMLAKDASDRFQTPDEVAQALAPFTAGANLAALAQCALCQANGSRSEEYSLADAATPIGIAACDTRDGRQGEPTPWSASNAASHAPTQSDRGTPLPTGTIGATWWSKRWLPLAAIGTTAAIVAAIAIPGTSLPTDNRHVQDVDDARIPSDTSLPLSAAASGTDTRDGADAESQLPKESDVERDVALWALANGGEVTIYPGGRVTRVQSLPVERFRVQMLKVFSGVTDDDVARLRGLADLQGVELRKNPITDRAMAELVEIPSLRWLYLSQTKITDAHLPDLSRLKSLLSLGLEQTNITDAGFRQIQGLTSLRELRLALTAIEDPSLEHLKNFPSLVRLDLFHTRITNAGLKHLTTLPNLAYLDLQDNRIDDQGAVELARLTRLKELNVKQTDISAEGVQMLRDALPGCRVDY